MAVIVDALASQLAETLVTLLKDEVTKIIGAKKELIRLLDKVEALQGLLVDAEKKAFGNATIRNWLAKLKDVFYDVEDVADYYRSMGERLAVLPSLELQSQSMSMVRCCHPLVSHLRRLPLRHQIGGRIRDVNERLAEIMKENKDFGLEITARIGDHRSSITVHRRSDPLLEPVIVGVGVENDTRILVAQLTCAGGPAPVSIHAIVGMGGIGKTTLAQMIYNNKTIKDTFRTPPPIWVCVSKEYSDTSLLGEIIRLAKGSTGGAQSIGELQVILSEVILHNKLFLILDDVWDARIWNDLLCKPFHGAAVGSKILITTRNEQVARDMGVVNLHSVQPLSLEEGWLLVCRMLFKEGEEGEIQLLADIGIEIVKKCNGLPLAIRTIIGVLGSRDRRRSEWESVLHNPAWSVTDLPHGVLGALYLSYEDLPFHLKQCFIFCSVFPEDHLFMRHTLIQLWVAEGYVEEERGSIMEEVARGYYRELLRRSLLERDPHYYDDGGCKMHDLLRSLAQFLGGREIFIGDVEAKGGDVAASFSSLSSSSIKLRHFSVTSSSVDLPTLIAEQPCLRTLLFNGISMTSPFSEDLFKKLERLRVVDFTKTDVVNLSTSIGNLIHLRYLDLSGSTLKKLPETIGNLINLQYLILQHCEDLESLPKGITRLYKLRSLDLLGTPVDGLPMGIGRLQHLNRLMGFVTNECSGGSRGWCSLEELRSLSKLRTLTIENLERVLALGSRDGGGSLLKDKRHLRHLELSCTTHGEQQQEFGELEKRSIKLVFEQLLSPPDSLEKFELMGYFGLEYPSWMMGNNSRSLFSNLRRLDLRKCIHCRYLPPLGQLPLLDLLYVKEALAVESIGPEFMGWDRWSVAGVAPHRPAFPVLKELMLKGLPHWTEWIWEAADEAVAMRRLETLSLKGCPNLKSLPEGIVRHATALSALKVQDAHNIRAIEGHLALERLFAILNAGLATISNLPALQILQIISCPALRKVERVDSLRVLEVIDLEMESLPEWLLPRGEGDQPPFPMLQELNITVGSTDVLRRCIIDGPDWPKIRHFPRAYIQCQVFDEFGPIPYSVPEFVFYHRNPFAFTTSFEAVAGGPEGVIPS